MVCGEVQSECHIILKYSGKEQRNYDVYNTHTVMERIGFSDRNFRLDADFRLEYISSVSVDSLPMSEGNS